jgi:hypothetical protein
MAPRLIVLGAALFSLLACGAVPPGDGSPKRWYKGTTHAHTLWDNGDALPEVVADWYRSRGYNFLVLSDHNERNSLTGRERWIHLPDPELPANLRRRFGPDLVALREVEGRPQIKLKTFAELRAAFDDPGRFALLPGQEIDDRYKGKLIHHNTINCERILLPPGSGSVREAMTWAVGAVESESARTGTPSILHLNHPNLGWAVGAEDLAAVEKERFFEVYSGHPATAIQGDSRHPGTERMWDLALTERLRSKRGPLLYGVATDDAHDYHGKGDGRPGRGWIVVRARELSGAALVRAMEAGDFYASTGVTLEEIRGDDAGLFVKAASDPGATFTIRFLGSRAGSGEIGTVFREVKGPEAAYAFTGDELYVRAVVVSDRPPSDPSKTGDLQKAWIQPITGPGSRN